MDGEMPEEEYSGDSGDESQMDKDSESDTEEGSEISENDWNDQRDFIKPHKSGSRARGRKDATDRVVSEKERIERELFELNVAYEDDESQDGGLLSQLGRYCGDSTTDAHQKS